MFPTQYRFIYVSSTSATTADFAACQSLVITKISKGFFGWDNASKACTYGAAIYGFIYGVGKIESVVNSKYDMLADTVTPAALLSPTSSEVWTVSTLEAETHIMNEGMRFGSPI